MFGQSKWRQSQDVHFEMKRNTYISLILVISVDDWHMTMTIVNTEIILQGFILYYYSPLGSSSKSHHFNGTCNIKHILGKNTSFLTPFSAFWIPSLNLSKTSLRKFVFKLNETQQFISLVQRKLSHDPTNKMSWDISPPEHRS